MGDWDLFEAGEDDPRAFATELRNRSLQTMGNLAILMQPLNTAEATAPGKTNSRS